MLGGAKLLISRKGRCRDVDSIHGRDLGLFLMCRVDVGTLGDSAFRCLIVHQGEKFLGFRIFVSRLRKPQTTDDMCFQSSTGTTDKDRTLTRGSPQPAYHALGVLGRRLSLG